MRTCTPPKELDSPFFFAGKLCSLMPDQPVMVHAAYPTPELGNPTSQRTPAPNTNPPRAHKTHTCPFVRAL
jgi:hypothetical protein